MTEFYKAIYDYTTDQKDELSVKEGEVLRITNKENADWWIAERINHSNKFGLVPSNFLEVVQLGVAIIDYEAQGQDELDLKRDDKVVILEKDQDWTRGQQTNGKTGLFPSNCIEDYSAEKQKPGFKLAAYGVKQGGIGSILAGEIQKKTHKDNENEEPRVPLRPTLDTKKTDARAMVLHDYTAENEDEITLMRGEYITVLDHSEQSGWWKGANERGNSGVFPANFVQLIEKAPERPTRTRPPTVKSEESNSSIAPPPVPVGTRPSSLLTSRPTSPPARPLTSPPPRPLTSPPRSLSISTKHRRTPSIPVTSPDLPAMSPAQSARPVIPRPTSSVDAAMNNMAKPPKINFTPKLPPTPSVPTPPVPALPVLTPSPPPPATTTTTTTSGPVAPPRPASRPPSRPTSIQDPHPPLPKRSMPSLPPTDEIETIIQKELDKLRQEFEVRLQQERKRLEEMIRSQLK